MIHFYRGEVAALQYLAQTADTTTNWAYYCGATLSFVLLGHNAHFVIPINQFWWRSFSSWRRAVSLLRNLVEPREVIETGYFAPMLAPESVPLTRHGPNIWRPI